jgi:cytochrome c
MAQGAGTRSGSRPFAPFLLHCPALAIDRSISNNVQIPRPGDEYSNCLDRTTTDDSDYMQFIQYRELDAVVQSRGKALLSQQIMRRFNMSPRSPDDAKTWVENAKKFYRSAGKRIALAEFTNPTGMFVQGEMYIYALNPKGTMLAHGVNEKFVGEEFIDLTDSDGKKFIKEIVDSANANGAGWVEYKWYHPVTKQWLPKIAYFEKVDDLIIVSAVYKG